MSINRRTAIAVRSIGVASAAAALSLAVGGTAFACDIRDFTADVSCNTATGKADVKVTDTDTSGTAVDVTVYVGDKNVGSGHFNGASTTQSIDIQVPWYADSTYRVHVQTVGSNRVDSDVTKGSLTTNGTTCAAPTTPTPTPTDSTTPPASTPPASTPPTTAPASPTPSASTTSPAPAVGDTNAPSPAAGTQDLAETGGGSNTGMIAGIAAALVAAGAGAVFFLRRKTATARH
ncbi:LAETG motif-containing sortase-dependent surface protein [Actinacidiphila sp. DG2A-62]|uniref:LAETG motif-containing sortase-dependent surface protein n=1 Tax=Actinacidiphila sp. DG2A-62 TaxID=3108821 RepID=UPI002DB566CD|nr:LAETG motif-containing sortase-dependent surface protein [Actinacidiphila sp. DG2A-62]MEC3994534.1 LAETG motif-containing sortase-dependent surface protein [Actinacidiphila sp. DG2A-62]